VANDATPIFYEGSVSTPSFNEVVEAVDRLSIEEQEVIADILQHRLAEQGRKRVAAEVDEARREFSEGECRPATTDDLMDEILS
jgi:hypothetical protein